ncbi:DeoR/GlpR family transcriptional regulator of sugar metabolism [Rhizobium sp. SG_E_25_P2]|jgi:DeoR/GlpR family transcriptional regulator of sugar metabolism|uniref:DeoR/GlpR family DNA-binding transcription regulator n=1 Tax=Rhizobium sp. SG_E_25_P2 TaxID=2879942 RepID=UPI0024763182|nr:DeoR/GlpR family DNA-binding transcription regulator [Rhizobium sp. SG_E_25_P2]MDH6268495.1 DeoR/GlpR family transcriptional regulator of sugar metabolism [Rhizobium sp. SG_E_25_P2]
MLTTERKAVLIERLKAEGRIVAKAFAEEFQLSEDTIRRDLRELAAEGLLRRVHGGALPVAPDLPDLGARRAIAADVKARLAEKAARLVQSDQLIFLDGGSTNAALARALPRTFAFTVATHSPTIAAELGDHPTADVILIGGRLYKHSMVATGALAAEQIGNLRPDLFFLGVTGLHPRHGLTTGDAEEAAIKRRIAGQSAETWTLLTSAKLDAVSPCLVLPLDAVTGVLVGAEDGASPDLSDYRAKGLEISVV